MKRLLVVTAALEAVTGIALSLAPSLVVSLLLGAPLDTPASLAVARVAGVAVLGLGLACWLASGSAPSREARDLVTAMLLYNVGAAAVLVQAGLGSGVSGPGVWLAAGLHTSLAAWCVASLRRRNAGGNQ